MTDTAPPATPDPQALQRWREVRTLFDRLLDLPPAERAAVLAAAQVPAAVRAEVGQLLAHAEAAPGSTLDGDAAGWLARQTGLRGAATGAAGSDAARAPAGHAGQVLAAWRLVAPLGQGGMGEVWRAERADGRYDGVAAIKLLRPGSASFAASLALEQRALARLNHPHIARLFDAGLSPEGCPYFVMEFVDGQPLTAAAAPLPLAQKLRLFLQLGDAVAHAHRMLLVHCDLKPANVLVDREGQVKLLDFGIAKALQEGAAGLQGAVPAYTPHYASPEQVRGEPADTATDIYALGVMLYELLTGERPYGGAAASPKEAAQAVLTAPVSAPSARAAVDPAAAPVPAARLRGDLDAIVLRAMQRAREGRYPTVDAFMADLRAWLDGRPVSARPARWSYVAGRWAARHRWVVAASAAAVLALLGGLGATAWQAHRAELARADAEQRLADVRRLTQGLVFRFGDAVSYLPGGMQIKEDLLRDTLATLERLVAVPGADDALVGLAAATYGRLAELQANDDTASLGKPEDALRHADLALALAARLSPSHVHDWRLVRWLGAAHAARFHTLLAQGRAAEADAALAAGTRYLDAQLARRSDEPQRLFAVGERAFMRLTAAQRHAGAIGVDAAALPGAIARFDAARAEYQALLAQGPALDVLDAGGRPEEPKARHHIAHQIGTTHGAQALLYLRHDRLGDARRAAESALALRRETVTADPRTAIWRDQLMVDANTLAVVSLRQGDHPAALAAARLSWEAAGQLAHEHGPDSKWARSLVQLAPQWGRALARNGRPGEALPVLDSAQRHWDAVLAREPAQADAARRAAWMRVEKARALDALGRRAEAAPLVVQALALTDAVPQAAPARRDAWLVAASAWAWRMRMAASPQARLQARAQALAAFDAAAALRALAEDQLGEQAAVRAGGRGDADGRR